MDTSFLVALYNEDDRFHREAREVSLLGDRFLVPTEIWAEFVDVLMRVLPPKQASAVLSNALEGPFDVRPVLTAEEFPRLVDRAQQIRPRGGGSSRRPLSVFDLVVCAVAERYREAILTFDEGIIAAVRNRSFPGARIR